MESSFHATPPRPSGLGTRRDGPDGSLAGHRGVGQAGIIIRLPRFRPNLECCWSSLGSSASTGSRACTPLTAAGTSRTAGRCAASSSCCTPASPGGACRPSWAAARASPAGDASTGGGGPASGAAARPAAGAPARRRRDRLLAGGRRLQPRAGQKGGAATGPSPVDYGAAGAPRRRCSTCPRSDRPRSRRGARPRRCAPGPPR